MSYAPAIEANYDGLVGPTHNYGGLSAGNMASQANAGHVSNPRAGALQGLEKMRAMAARGFVQGVLPPQERPFMPLLRAAGFTGASDAAVLEAAWRADPQLVRNAAASAFMWAANAATVTPSADAADGRVHFTPANLHTMLHRAIEPNATARALASAFPEPARFSHHAPLPAHAVFADEGAANHMRLCAELGAPGVEAFVYGRDGYAHSALGAPQRQARQTGEAIARAHGLAPARTVHIRQSDAAIAAGAFHNDVVAVAHETVLFCHERAFEDRDGAFEALRRAAEGLFEPVFVEVAEADLPLEDAIASYLFNSQLVRAPGASRLTLIAPAECQENPRARTVCEALTGGNGPIGEVAFVDVRQSMRNGGGPACLRLRVVLTEAERAAAHQGLLVDDALLDRLSDWARRRYRDRLAPDDLADPALVDQTRAALDELTGILALGSDFYDFQRAGA